MANDESVSHWINRLKEGDQQAAQKLWQRYIEDLVRRAHAKLGGAPRRVADEEDLAAAAFASFFRGMEAGRFPQMDDRDDLWQVLVVLLERKVVDHRRRELAAKRGRGAVRGESALGVAGSADSFPKGFDQVVDNAPTPADDAETAEQLRRLFGLLNDETLQRIALAKLEGYTNAEIAKQLGRSVTSIERKLRLIRGIWQGADDEETADT